MIKYQILWTDSIRIVWQTVGAENKEILIEKGFIFWDHTWQHDHLG